MDAVAPALQQLIAKWRARATATEANSTLLMQPVTLTDMLMNRVLTLNECADELETALAGIGEASASSPMEEVTEAPKMASRIRFGAGWLYLDEAATGVVKAINEMHDKLPTPSLPSPPGERTDNKG